MTENVAYERATAETNRKCDTLHFSGDGIAATERFQEDARLFFSSPLLTRRRLRARTRRCVSSAGAYMHVLELWGERGFVCGLCVQAAVCDENESFVKVTKSRNICGIGETFGKK